MSAVLCVLSLLVAAALACDPRVCGEASVIAHDQDPAEEVRGVYRRSLVFRGGMPIQQSDAVHDNSADFGHSGSGTCDLTLRLYGEADCNTPWLFQYRLPPVRDASICLNMHAVLAELKAVHAMFHAHSPTPASTRISHYAQAAVTRLETHFLGGAAGNFDADFLELHCNSSLAAVELRVVRYAGLDGTAQPPVIASRCPAQLATIDRVYPNIYRLPGAAPVGIELPYLVAREPVCLRDMLLPSTAVGTDYFQDGTASRANQDAQSVLGTMGFVHSDTLIVDPQRPVPPQGLSSGAMTARQVNWMLTALVVGLIAVLA